MSPELLKLKLALEHRVGFSINTIRNCKKLDEWLKRKGTYISYSTFSRMFGVANMKTNPRQRTLDELSLVLGYPDFDSFISSSEKENEIDHYPFELQIEFEMCLEMDNLKEASKLYLEIIRLNSSSSFLAKDLSNKLYREFDWNKQHLKFLADDPLGRDLFFLKYIDEDDIHRGYERGLSEIFSQDAAPLELEFIDLYKSRKVIMAKGLKDSSILWDWINQDASNIHHLSRKIELRLINNRFQDSKSKNINIEQIIFDTLKSFKRCKNSQEELALIGRFCRGVLLSNAESIIKQHNEMCQLIFELLHHQLTDFEFQFPMHCLLNRINISKPLSIPSSSRWPNAYFTSTFLIHKNQSLSNSQKFYSKKININREFFD